MSTASAEVRELRQQIRGWRRGRADTKIVDAFSDAYIAVFAALMLGSMLANVVVNVRTATTAVCTSTACEDARDWLPWLAAVAALTMCVSLSRLFGPMLVSPAVGTWLLPTPVSRAALLRPRLAGTSVVALVLGALVAGGASTLGGLSPGAVGASAVGIGTLCVATVGLSVVAQARHAPSARVATWLLATALWLGLLLLVLGVAPRTTAPPFGGFWVGVVSVGVALAALACWRAAADLPLLDRHQLTPGGSLMPSLSGALASLDFALVYDVLIGRHWLARSTVRVARGRGTGAGALMWRDVIRMRRSPQLLLVLASSLVVPYLAASVGMARVVVLVAAGTGWVAGLGLFSALRVVSRTPGLARCLPLDASEIKTACLAAPGTVLAVWALATTPAMHTAMDLTWSGSVLAALAVGLGAIATITRWMTGKPPNYQLPMVTSPIGAVPPSLYVAAIRGFDVLLLVTAPLLISPSPRGAMFSLGISAVLLTVLVSWRSPAAA